MIQCGGNLVLSFNESSYNDSFDPLKILPTVHWNPAPRPEKEKQKQTPSLAGPKEAQQINTQWRFQPSWENMSDNWIFLKIGVKNQR